MKIVPVQVEAQWSRNGNEVLVNAYATQKGLSDLSRLLSTRRILRCILQQMVDTSHYDWSSIDSELYADLWYVDKLINGPKWPTGPLGFIEICPGSGKIVMSVEDDVMRIEGGEESRAALAQEFRSLRDRTPKWGRHQHIEPIEGFVRNWLDDSSLALTIMYVPDDQGLPFRPPDWLREDLERRRKDQARQE